MRCGRTGTSWAACSKAWRLTVRPYETTRRRSCNWFDSRGQAPAADSVVVGHGISNSYFSDARCAPDLICMEARYLWILDVRRTVSGPSVVGRIRVVASQHTDANEQFVKSVELFVLKPIDDSSLQRTSGARYYLVALSARDSSGNYCLSVDPGGAGLKLDSLQVSVDEERLFLL